MVLLDVRYRIPVRPPVNRSYYNTSRNNADNRERKSLLAQATSCRLNQRRRANIATLHYLDPGKGRNAGGRPNRAVNLNVDRRCFRDHGALGVGRKLCDTERLSEGADNGQSVGAPAYPI